jgi:anthranilate phosphoribosyltransferase
MTALVRLPDPREAFDAATAAQAFRRPTCSTCACRDEAIAEFLIALTERGETSVEIAAAAQALRDRMIPIDAPAGAVDVCGTGGDGHHTLNVSTAVAIVVAACGVPVAKHGNRAASSKAGAADTLEALGLDLARVSESAEETLNEIGICFLFAATIIPRSSASIRSARRSAGGRSST